MISSPYPLPLLLPKVDLRGKTSCLGYTLSTAQIYDTFWISGGLRRNNNAIFSGGRFGSDDRGYVYYERDSSFTLQVSTSGVLGPAMGSASTAIKYGDKYRVYLTSPNWSTQASTTTSYTILLSGTSYSVSAASLENFFAYSQSYTYGSMSMLTSISNFLAFPWLINWNTATMMTVTSAPTAADMQTMGLHYIGTADARYYRPIGFAPKRPLQKTPELISEERVDQLVSLSGKSYRASYARRCIYEVTLLLDGPLDQTYFDAEALWPRFVAACDAGITLFIDREWPSQFWRPWTSIVCPSMPNMISGTLLDASNLRLVTRQGIPDAYEVTIQIADESGIDGFNFGGATI